MPAVDRGDNLEIETPVVETPEVETPELEVKEPEVKEPESKEPEVKERDDQGRFIPKGRFDEAVGKERAARETAERKLAELQATLKQVDRNANAEKLESEIVGLEKQHSKLLLDGDHEKAAELMSQIRLKERTIAIQEATHLTASVKNEMREERRYDAAVESLEATYDARRLRRGPDRPRPRCAAHLHRERAPDAVRRAGQGGEDRDGQARGQNRGRQ